MKKLTVLALVFGAFLLTSEPAQAQTIRGIVVEDGTRAPIAGALVELVTPDGRSAAAAQTDGGGVFLLRPANPGSFVVRLKHLAYAPLNSDTLRIGRGETVEIEVRLAQTAIPLEPLVVTARRDARLEGFYERQRKRSFGHFMTRQEIERRAGTRTTDLLNMMPGVRIVQVTGPGGMGAVNMITLRGGGSGRCLPTIYVDGMEMKQFPESGVDDFLSPYILEGVEVYTMGGAPTSIMPRGNCGVVAFWTRMDSRRPWSWKRFAAGLGALAFMFAVTR
jgi:hypothetical protein